jgi:hypothetical protein
VVQKLGRVTENPGESDRKLVPEGNRSIEPFLIEKPIEATPGGQGGRVPETWMSAWSDSSDGAADLRVRTMEM